MTIIANFRRIDLMKVLHTAYIADSAVDKLVIVVW